MARGVAARGAHARLTPVADGGDGTLDVLLAAGGTAARVTLHTVAGPLGAPVRARLGWRGPVAVVEMAEASGLRLLRGRRLDALRATSRGAGELLREALTAGAQRVIVGVGGSASTDGGAGLLQALGARLLDADGRDIPPGGEGLLRLEHLDLSAAKALAGKAVDVAVDVRNPLLGPNGAAVVFAPQKGASPDEATVLERGLARFLDVAQRDAGPEANALASLEGAGAAGGCGFGLALVGAHLLPGAPLVCDLVALDAALDGTALVLTGEGRLDSQTALGKAPAEVARRAKARGVPCVAVGGRVLDPLTDTFTGAISLEQIGGGADPERHVRRLLREAAALAVDRYVVSRPT
jgi:glycerate 2-kinase